MNNFRSAALHDTTHYIDSGIVTVKKGSSRYYADFVAGYIYFGLHSKIQGRKLQNFAVSEKNKLRTGKDGRGNAVFVMVVFIGIRFYGFYYVYARKREMVGKNSKKLHQPKKLCTFK
jgi:hypothetical protein